jgi:hypothetical protein
VCFEIIEDYVYPQEFFVSVELPQPKRRNHSLNPDASPAAAAG